MYKLSVFNFLDIVKTMHYKKHFLQKNICAIYLSLGGVVWFYNTSIGVYKSLILLFLLFLCRRFFTKANLYGWGFTVFLLVLLYISHEMSGKDFSDFLPLSWGLIDNFIFFTIGYNFTKNGFVDADFSKTMLFSVSFFCLLTVTNFLFNTPDWISPIDVERTNKIYYDSRTIIENIPLYSSGFGLGRTGWGHTLALCIPFSLYFFLNNDRKVLPCILILITLLSVILSGSRGAFLSVLTIFCLYMAKKASKSFISVVFLLVLFSPIILIYGEQIFNFITEHFRLDNSDISNKRFEQYSHIPNMINEMGVWGLGVGGTKLYLSNLGLDYSLHNNYIRIFLEHGWVVGLIGGCWVLFIMKLTILTILKEKQNTYQFCASCVIISGLISCFFEPNAVFLARTWYVVWWFSLGIIFNNYRKKKVNYRTKTFQ